MNLFPTPFTDPCQLPFNRRSLALEFELKAPDRDPGGPGYLLLLRGSELLVQRQGEGRTELPLDPRIETEQAPLYIGQWQGRPCRALRLSREQEAPEGLAPRDILAEYCELSPALLSLGGVAGQILYWHKNSRHCSLCAAPSEALPGEWGRRCPSCGHARFPALHPCVIVLVVRGDELLLTRKTDWVPHRYSLVAGFVDFGECLEEAAVREVREETAVEIGNLRYLGSQNWPFPSQLMAGFVADWTSGEIRVCEKELEDARWFRKDALPGLPPRRSIARYLIDRVCG